MTVPTGDSPQLSDRMYEQVVGLAALAEQALDWLANPTTDAPAIVLVGELRDRLHDLERDMRCDRLARGVPS